MNPCSCVRRCEDSEKTHSCLDKERSPEKTSNASVAKKNDVRKQGIQCEKRETLPSELSTARYLVVESSFSGEDNAIKKRATFYRSSLRLVVISDTHGRYRRLSLPPGDVLVHCGDCLGNCFLPTASKMAALKDFFEWLNAQPCAVKIFIGGNHDGAFARYTPEAMRQMAAPALYLCHESAIIEPIHWRVFGTPQSICNSVLSPFKAFQCSTMQWMGDTALDASLCRENEKYKAGPLPPPQALPSSSLLTVRLEPHFALGSGPIDILLTHQGLMPEGKSSRNGDLLKFISKISPLRLHCGGHLHRGHGLYWLHRDTFRLEHETGLHDKGASLYSAYKFHSTKELEKWKEKSTSSVGSVHVEAQPNDLLSVNPACTPKHILSKSLRFPPTVLDLQL